MAKKNKKTRQRKARTSATIFRRLIKLGVLTLPDKRALEQLVENYVEILKLRKVINKEGRFVTRMTKIGEKVKFAHPAVIQLFDAEKRFRAMMCEFGFVPAARSLKGEKQ